jgi:hypothetical protein
MNVCEQLFREVHLPTCVRLLSIDSLWRAVTDSV